MESRLLEALKTISDDPDFLYCVPKLLKTDDDRNTLIRFIYEDERASYDTVQLLAISLRQKWDKSVINTSFDFTYDTKEFWNDFWERNDGLGCGGNDPDTYSPVLRSYHAILWSRETPSGIRIELKEGSWDSYLTWNNQRFGSDSITTGFRYKKCSNLLEQVKEAVPNYRAMVEDYVHKTYTIGGEIIFPKHRHSMNQDRGVNARIVDRWDLTLECIRRYYLGEDSPLYKTCCRDKDYYDLFVDFKGYVDYFYLQDMVSRDYSSVELWLDTELFENNPFPRNPKEYLSFLDKEIQFVEKRNSRIADKGRSK